MRINKKTGWLKHARCVPSPFFDERPDKSDISLIVIHDISLPSGKFGNGNIDKLFTGKLDVNAHPSFKDIPELKISTHVLIDRKGKLTQYVSFYDYARHAGVSSFQGRDNCNDYSIGIELEGTDDLPYEKVQYKRLAKLVKTLLKTFPKTNKERIAGHADVAVGRKTDPGPAFDWKLFYKLLS